MRPAVPIALALLALAALAAAAEPTHEVRAGTRPDGTMYYEPAEINATAGEEVTIRFVNLDTRDHDLVIDGLGFFDFEIELYGKKSAEGSFTAKAPGNYTMFCELIGHKAAGMVGVLRVVGEKQAPALPAALALPALLALALVVRRQRP